MISMFSIGMVVGGIAKNSKIAGVITSLLKSAILGLPIDNMFLPICILGAIAIICVTISIKFFKWE